MITVLSYLFAFYAMTAALVVPALVVWVLLSGPAIRRATGRHATERKGASHGRH